MLISAQTAGGGAKTYDNAEYDFPSGVYLCQLKDVVEIGPKADDERQTPRLVFEFVVADGPHAGKKTATFVKKNLFAGSNGRGNASALFKLAVSLGVTDPMGGFDTTQLIGRYYTIMVKNENGRAWPVSYIGAEAPGVRSESISGTAPAAPAGGPPPRPKKEARFWATVEGYGDELFTVDQLKTFVSERKLKVTDDVCPDGSSDWQPLTVAVPESAAWDVF